MKGSERGQAITTTTTTSPGEEKWTLPYHTPTLMTKREERRGKDACRLPELGSLAGYVGCALCVNLPMLGVVSTPPQYIREQREFYF
jgi:hypothetical protein